MKKKKNDKSVMRSIIANNIKEDSSLIIANNIKTARKAMGITQKQLAELCGFHVGTIQQYELGKRTPRADYLITLAKNLNVSAFDLLEGVFGDYDGISHDEILYLQNKRKQNKFYEMAYNLGLFNDLNDDDFQALKKYADFLRSQHK